MEVDKLKHFMDRLKNSVLHANTIMHQIDLYNDFKIKDPKNEADIQGLFFGYVRFCFWRVLVLEVYKLVWPNEEMNLRKFLDEFYKNYAEVDPRKYNDEIVTIDEYKQVVKSHSKALKSIEDVQNKIQILRNGIIAHAYEDTFFEQDELLIQNEVSFEELKEVLLLVTEIVKYHYALLTNSDMDLNKIHSPHNIDLYLKRSLGFQRFWKNKQLNRQRMKKYLFLSPGSEYDEDDIFF